MKVEEICGLLDSKGINYRLHEHKAVFTIEEMREIGKDYSSHVAKNLFLKDDKHKTYYLLVVDGDKRVNVNEFRKKLGTNRMSFARDEDLMEYLGLTSGSVSPLGVLNDKNHVVTVIIDKEIADWKEVAVHPNINTASLWIAMKDLIRVIKENGNEVEIMEV